MTILDTHREDDIRNTELNDRKIKRRKHREGDGIRTPNGATLRTPIAMTLETF